MASGRQVRRSRLIFVNKMDKIGADFYRCIDDPRAARCQAPRPQLPIGAETEFVGVVDLIEMKALVWGGEDLGAHWDVRDIPADLQARAEEYREKLVETAVELDEAVMEAYLEGEMPDNDTLRKLIRKGICGVEFFGVCCGSAFKNKGVQPLLDAVVDFLPSPIDIASINGIDAKTEEPIERHADDSEPLSMLAFKIANDPHMGSLTFCRIYSGHLEAGAVLENTVKGKRERVGRMFQMHSNSREQITEAFAGDIVAIVRLRATTGDTLCTPALRSFRAHGLPDPVIDIAVEPKSKADQEKMGLALQRLAAEDPSFRVRSDESGRQLFRAWASFTSTFSSIA